MRAPYSTSSAGLAAVWLLTALCLLHQGGAQLQLCTVRNSGRTAEDAGGTLLKTHSVSAGFLSLPSDIQRKIMKLIVWPAHTKQGATAPRDPSPVCRLFQMHTVSIAASRTALSVSPQCVHAAAELPYSTNLQSVHTSGSATAYLCSTLAAWTRPLPPLREVTISDASKRQLRGSWAVLSRLTGLTQLRIARPRHRDVCNLHLEYSELHSALSRNILPTLTQLRSLSLCVEVSHSNLLGSGPGMARPLFQDLSAMHALTHLAWRPCWWRPFTTCQAANAMSLTLALASLPALESLALSWACDLSQVVFVPAAPVWEGSESDSEDGGEDELMPLPARDAEVTRHCWRSLLARLPALRALTSLELRDVWLFAEDGPHFLQQLGPALRQLTGLQHLDVRVKHRTGPYAQVSPSEEAGGAASQCIASAIGSLTQLSRLVLSGFQECLHVAHCCRHFSGLTELCSLGLRQLRPQPATALAAGHPRGDTLAGLLPHLPELTDLRLIEGMLTEEEFTEVVDVMLAHFDEPPLLEGLGLDDSGDESDDDQDW